MHESVRAETPQGTPRFAGFFVAEIAVSPEPRQADYGVESSGPVSLPSCGLLQKVFTGAQVLGLGGTISECLG